MASAWYHYPMYDEALRKLLGTFEMAIKLRSKASGIQLTKYTNLQGLINKLFPVEKVKQLNAQLHFIRRIRNQYAHPTHHYFGAIAIRPLIISLINALNQLFLPEESMIANQAQVATLAKIIVTLQASVLIVEREQKRYLIREAIPLNAHVINKKVLSLWVFYPILNNISESILEGKCHHQLYLF